MRKMDLQQEAVKLINQLSNEKLKAAVDYLVRLRDKRAQDILTTEVDSTVPLGTAVHEIFKPFSGVDLEIPPREPMRELPRF